MSSVEIELDDELLALVDLSVATSGRDRSQVIADAIRKQLTTNTLRAIIDRAPSKDDPSDDEAMQLAVDEQRYNRAERRAHRPAVR